MQVKISIYLDDVLRATRVVSTPCGIGRSKNLGLTVAHPAISRNHCELTESGGTLRLIDNGSLNGTIYGGDMIEGEVLLADEDEFSIGDVRFVVQKVSGPELAVELENTTATAEEPVDETANTIINAPDRNPPGAYDNLRLADD